MAEIEAGSSKGFWHTLPGILTGSAATIAAITSLVAALYQFSKPTDAAQKPSANQVAGAPAEDFEAIPTQDGFTSVRETPSTKSVEKRRLAAGTVVTCQAVVKGEAIFGSSDWRYCPGVGGYIHSKLLIPKKK